MPFDLGSADNIDVTDIHWRHETAFRSQEVEQFARHNKFLNALFRSLSISQIDLNFVRSLATSAEDFFGSLDFQFREQSYQVNLIILSPKSLPNILKERADDNFEKAHGYFFSNNKVFEDAQITPCRAILSISSKSEEIADRFSMNIDGAALVEFVAGCKYFFANGNRPYHIVEAFCEALYAFAAEQSAAGLHWSGSLLVCNAEEIEFQFSMPLFSTIKVAGGDNFPSFAIRTPAGRRDVEQKLDSYFCIIIQDVLINNFFEEFEQPNLADADTGQEQPQGDQPIETTVPTPTKKTNDKSPTRSPQVTARGTPRKYRGYGVEGSPPALDTKIGARVPGALKEDWDAELTAMALRAGPGLEQALAFHTEFLRKARACGYSIEDLDQAYAKVLSCIEKLEK